jgi:hypothetical protein
MKKLFPLLFILSLQIQAQDSSLCTLPVHFTNIKVNISSQNAWITWQTASTKEEDAMLDHFEVEKSTDKVFFQKIAAIAPNSVGYYTVQNTLQGPAFYRVKQLDKDGRHLLSPVIFATVKIDGVALTQDANTQEVSLAIYAKEKSMYAVSVRNLSGGLVAKRELFLSAGANFTKINTDSLVKGIYLVTVSNGARLLLTQKIVK